MLALGRPWSEIANHLGLPLVRGSMSTEFASYLEETQGADPKSRLGRLKFQAAIRLLGFERSLSLREERLNRASGAERSGSAQAYHPPSSTQSEEPAQ